MKKILVLMLVLGMASMATAGLSIVTDGSDTFTIDSDAAGNADIYIIVDSALGYDLVYTNIIGGGMSSSMDYDVMFGGPFDPMANLAITDTLPISYVEQATLAESPPAELPAGVWASVQVTGVSFVSSGTAVAWIYDTGTTSLIDTAYIPEPMTLALLGLGGLFLRRRK